MGGIEGSDRQHEQGFGILDLLPELRAPVPARIGGAGAADGVGLFDHLGHHGIKIEQGAAGAVGNDLTQLMPLPGGTGRFQLPVKRLLLQGDGSRMRGADQR